MGFLRSAARSMHSWFELTLDALFAPNIPFKLRWRMLVSQPSTLWTYILICAPWWFSKPFTVEYLAIAPGRSLKVLVFKAPGDDFDAKSGTTKRKLRPLHIDIHGGGFIGGLPEADAYFCSRLARETGTVVLATTYRHAPRHPFPAAVDDIDALLSWLRAGHAEKRFGADASLLSVSGSSAGGNLALAGALSLPRGAVKAAVTFYAAVDLRSTPSEKPRPATVPISDPLEFMHPLFDSYAAEARFVERANPRLSPCLADLDDLPRDMLLVVPGMDILVQEQLEFVERLRKEVATDERHQGRRIRAMYVDMAVHGWLELPSFMVPQHYKDFVFDQAISFIQETQAKYGWSWDAKHDPSSSTWWGFCVNTWQMMIASKYNRHGSSKNLNQ